jgi:hypothetical protein
VSSSDIRARLLLVAPLLSPLLNAGKRPRHTFWVVPGPLTILLVRAGAGSWLSVALDANVGLAIACQQFGSLRHGSVSSDLCFCAQKVKAPTCRNSLIGGQANHEPILNLETEILGCVYAAGREPTVR